MKLNTKLFLSFLILLTALNVILNSNIRRVTKIKNSNKKLSKKDIDVQKLIEKCKADDDFKNSKKSLKFCLEYAAIYSQYIKDGKKADCTKVISLREKILKKIAKEKSKNENKYNYHFGYWSLSGKLENLINSLTEFKCE